MSTVEYLTDRYSVDIFKERDEYGHSPAHWMALNGHFSIARYPYEDTHIHFSGGGGRAKTPKSSHKTPKRAPKILKRFPKTNLNKMAKVVSFAISSLHWPFSYFLCCFSSTGVYSDYTSPFYISQSIDLFLQVDRVHCDMICILTTNTNANSF